MRKDVLAGAARDVYALVIGSWAVVECVQVGYVPVDGVLSVAWVAGNASYGPVAGIGRGSVPLLTSCSSCMHHTVL